MTIGHAVTGSKDVQFREPFIDVDEWRDEPVRHRYVHGGFAGSDTRFSFYLPPAERYEGRSVYLAFQTMHRHQVDPDFEPWQQFTEGGRPIYPQRPRKIGPIMARQGSGVSQSGRFAGKMIVVQTPDGRGRLPVAGALVPQEGRGTAR